MGTCDAARGQLRHRKASVVLLIGLRSRTEEILPYGGGRRRGIWGSALVGSFL